MGYLQDIMVAQRKECQHSQRDKTSQGEKCWTDLKVWIGQGLKEKWAELSLLSKNKNCST